MTPVPCQQPVPNNHPKMTYLDPLFKPLQASWASASWGLMSNGRVEKSQGLKSLTKRYSATQKNGLQTTLHGIFVWWQLLWMCFCGIGYLIFFPKKHCILAFVQICVYISTLFLAGARFQGGNRKPSSVCVNQKRHCKVLRIPLPWQEGFRESLKSFHGKWFQDVGTMSIFENQSKNVRLNIRHDGTPNFRKFGPCLGRFCRSPFLLNREPELHHWWSKRPNHKATVRKTKLHFVPNWSNYSDRKHHLKPRKIANRKGNLPLFQENPWKSRLVKILFHLARWKHTIQWPNFCGNNPQKKTPHCMQKNNLPTVPMAQVVPLEPPKRAMFPCTNHAPAVGFLGYVLLTKHLI